MLNRAGICRQVIAILVIAATCGVARSQAGLEDDRVMIQGFYWESYRHGHPEKFPNFGVKKWYEIVGSKADALKAGHFDLIWLPPRSYAGEYSAGYGPKEYF